MKRWHRLGNSSDTGEQAEADDGIEDGDRGFRLRQLGEDGIIRDDLGQEEGLHRSLGNDDPCSMMGAGKASQIRNGGRGDINFGLIVGGQSRADLKVDDGWGTAEEVDEV